MADSNPKAHCMLEAWPVLCTMFLVSAFELEGPFVVGMLPSHGDVRILLSGCPPEKLFSGQPKNLFFGVFPSSCFTSVILTVIHMQIRGTLPLRGS